MAHADLETRARAGDAKAQVQLAARLEGEGQDYEALQWLSRAAKVGEAEALGRLGIKLVLGQGAPQRPRDGLGLLADAEAAGDGRAATFLSVLAGLGLHLPQNWSNALGHLARAAGLGWAPAQQELAILSGGSVVDLKRWTSAPKAEVISEAPRLIALKAVAPPAACAFIIAQSQDRLVRAEVHDPRTGLPVMGQTRTNRVANFGLAETSLLNLLIQARIAAAAGAPMAHMEAFAVLNYAPGEEASEHHDYLDPAVAAYADEIARLGQRTATALLYLNADYQGGETDFPELGLAHRGEAGDAL
ncbi:MAG TPA: hypothetical protein VHX64_03405, partial [Caulobacteraceae bacterium]|nr:hypothetical protein [Caulobacteraceae bacterium]